MCTFQQITPASALGERLNICWPRFPEGLSDNSFQLRGLSIVSFVVTCSQAQKAGYKCSILLYKPLGISRQGQIGTHRSTQEVTSVNIQTNLTKGGVGLLPSVSFFFLFFGQARKSTHDHTHPVGSL